MRRVSICERLAVEQGADDARLTGMIGTSRGSGAVRVLTTNVAVVLLSSVLLTPDPGAATSGETCHGVAATVVGPPGQNELSGTDGPDVIVSNGVRSVYANAGDDL